VVGTLLRRGRGWLTPLLLLLPAVALMVWLMVLPLVETVSLSFKSWDGFTNPVGVGTENFSQLLHDPVFKEALKHNLFIVAAMPVWIGLPYSVAWALHRKVRGWKFFRFAYFIPVVLSPVVVGGYYSIVLRSNGAFNSFLGSIGLGALSTEWLNNPSITLPVVIAIIIWGSFGVGVLIFLSGLSSLDTEQIDAARIDGASSWQVQRHVVLWQMLPLFEFWTVLVVILSFTAVFPLIYTLTQGGPGHGTFTVDYDLYVEAFDSAHLGYASAMSVFLLVAMAVVGFFFIRLLRWRRA
jgi:ABC-type sugar transport system permease subunit